MRTSSPSKSREALASYLEERRNRIDIRLQQLVPGESEQPGVIHRAMRYSLFAGGKRIRPIFCLASSELISPRPAADVEAIGSTLELIHTYSLIHDDLPALDNDNYRRGKLTCHKVFGDAIAILAGDALLTLAFQVLAMLPATPAEVKASLAAELSRAAGTVDGMIGGQVADLEATNETNENSGEALGPAMLEYIHRSKTAALFRASVCLGAIAERANPEQLQAIARFGENAGLAFQIADDILDVESSSERLGKTAGKDALQKKLTYPALYGLERSKKLAREFVDRAATALDDFGDQGNTLKELAEYLVSRSA